MSTLRVTGLDPTLRGEEVQSFFARYGRILALQHTARMMEATVTYTSPEEAETALGETNGAILGSRTIQVRRPHFATRLTAVNVMGLSTAVTESDVRRLFGRYGEIVSLRRLGSHATITYLQPEGAAGAIAQANGRLLRGQTITVAPSFEVTPPVIPSILRPPRTVLRMPTVPARPTIVIVTGLPTTLSAETLRNLESLFRVNGRVIEMRFFLPRNRAEIDYESADGATDAVVSLDGVDIGGNEIQVAIEDETPPEERTVHLGNLNPAVTADVSRLRELMSRYGRIDRLESIGTEASVLYATEAATSDAIANLNGRALSDLSGNPNDSQLIRASVEGVVWESPRRREIPRRRMAPEPPPDEELIMETPPRADSPRREEARGRRYLLVREAQHLIASHFITQTMVDPENQDEVAFGLTRVTLIGVDGREYDVIGRYNKSTGEILPPS